MKMSNSTYDALKFLVTKILPALATLILAIGALWNIPYTEAAAGTITAICTFIGVIIGISSNNYYEDNQNGFKNMQ